MTGTWVWALLAGSAVGLGLGLLLYLVMAPQRPVLAGVLERAGVRPTALFGPDAAGDAAVPNWAVRTRRQLGGRLSRLPLTTPDADLAVLDTTREAFLLKQIGLTVLALAVGPVWAILLWALDSPVPAAVPFLAGPVLAVLVWLGVTSSVKSAAAERRREMKYALVSYLTLMALHRAAGAGSAASLELAARASESWAFRRIHRQVAAALRTQRSEWQALQDLAVELQIEELADLSSIAETAGVMGAHIGQTLLARAASLRHQLMASEQEKAGEATNRMSLPKALLGIALLAFLIFPPIATLATGS